MYISPKVSREEKRGTLYFATCLSALWWGYGGDIFHLCILKNIDSRSAERELSRNNWIKAYLSLILFGLVSINRCLYVLLFHSTLLGFGNIVVRVSCHHRHNFLISKYWFWISVTIIVLSDRFNEHIYKSQSLAKEKREDFPDRTSICLFICYVNCNSNSSKDIFINWYTCQIWTYFGDACRQKLLERLFERKRFLNPILHSMI